MRCGLFIAILTLPTAASIAPISPRNLTVETIRNRCNLAWAPVEHIRSYRVFVSGPNQFADSVAVDEPKWGGELKHPGLYEMAVAAVDSEGHESKRSRSVKAFRFHLPWGLAVTKDGRRIVRDAHFDQQAVLDPEGRAVGLSGQKGYALKGSYDIAIDNQGRILTAKWGESDTFGFVVQNAKFQVVHEYVRPAGNSPGEFRQPMGIGTDSKGNIYVADTGNNRVQQFTRDGKFQRIIGEGELRLPMKTVFDQKDRLYVADSGNNRVAVYEPDSAGAYKLERSITAGMKEPVYVAVDSAERVFVSTNRVAAVYMYNAAGEQSWKYEGDFAAPLSGPRGLALDRKGSLLIVDEASLRVLSVKVPKPSGE